MASDILQFVIYGALLLALAYPLGIYMARVFSGERTWLTPVLAPAERLLYRAAGVGGTPGGQHWTAYAMAVLIFNLGGWLVLYAILRLQGFLPWNPQGLGPMSPDLAFNTAVSFVTNTNWQAYGGETTLSYFSQMAGLTVQNFVSAATGIAVGAAVIRGFAGRQVRDVGNFWVDLARSVVYLLLPLSVIAALLLVWQGVPQNLMSTSSDDRRGAQQTIARDGRLADRHQAARHQRRRFFNVNSAHPYENPTALSNLLELVYILLIPAAFCVMFGRMVKDMRQGLAILAAMLVLFAGALALTYGSEVGGNPELASLPIDQSAGNMEGKEVRFGVGNSALWATATTAASNGSVNSMHESYMPLGALAPMLQMQIGEVIFGGVGSGFYGMLLFVVLTVFMAGLMVGRTPEYLGKKIEAKEVKLSILTFLIMPVGVLGFGALAAVLPVALASVTHAGPHGLAEILYNYSSATGNNGSAFAGFGANTPYHNTMQGIAMLLGRYVFIVPMLAVAGALATKKIAPPSSGTFPTHTPLFVTLLVAVILIVGGLTFFPALALGPIAEHFAMLSGQAF
jgi:K+-transporting ATPase ATPase A chain